MTASLRDLRLLGEAILTIAITWILLGWLFDRAITQADGTVLMVPFTDSALRAGADWTHHLYRFGVIGGSEMQPFAGALPLVQVCALLGLSTTLTVNLITIFIQLCFAFFGIKSIEALATRWLGSARQLTLPERFVAIWACGFAPILAWRLALGHENMLLGVLPLVASISLLWCARARTLSVCALVMGTVAVANGVAGLGEQSLVYGVVFGMPLAIAALLDAPGGRRWGRGETAIAAALAAGVLVCVPRLVGMIAHGLGDDATRGMHESVTYSYDGAGSWVDWLTSIPWTKALSPADPGVVHEHNYPIGPFVCFVVALWPRGASRRIVWGVVIGAALAIAFADDLAPISTGLLKLVPPLAAFRGPSRALLAVFPFVPVLALAALATRCEAARGSRAWVAVGVAIAVIVAGRNLPPIVREPAAWLACVGLIVAARLRPAVFQRVAFPALAVVVALGVNAFDERFPRDVPNDPIEDRPRQLREAVLAQAPEIAMPLARIEVLRAPPPYAMSTAFAAGLPSLDGNWHPPRRFLDLLAATSGVAVPPTTCSFDLARSRVFPVLQQLYNVRYLVSLGDAAMQPLPETNGPAWFPARVEVVDDAGEMVRALAAGNADLRGTLRDTGWRLRADAPEGVRSECATARVTGVTVDELGQTATIAVVAPEACTLVVATNFVTELVATADDHRLAVFPIDIALTGVAVPAGASTIVLGPHASIAWWSWLAAIAGVGLLGLAIGLVVRDPA